jgi:DNA-binding MarR family transcriptional regulator
LVARQADAGDRRRNVVGLTNTGQLTLKKAKAASDEAERRLLNELSVTEAQQLRELLSRIAPGRVRR